jgi:hypothetical protein
MMIERPRIGTPHVRGHRHVGGELAKQADG